MLRISIILGLALLLSTSQCLYLGVSSRPSCIQIEEDKGKTIKFFYEVTGDDPQFGRTDIFPQDGSPQINLVGAHNQTVLNGDTINRVCFSTTDGNYKSFSLDFYSHDKAHIMELALKSEIYQLHTKLIDVGQNLKQIVSNQQFQQQRQMIHAQMISNNQATIKKFALFKIVAIIAIALGQLFLLKNMLNKQGNGYIPV